MKASPRPDSTTGSEALTPEKEAAVKSAALWVQQFARTLKTCRLYDANNPTVVRFRQELHAALGSVLANHGPLALSFTSEDVLCEDVSLYLARSRDDNLAFPFFRDGIRSLTLEPGCEQREIDVLVDAVVQVTGQNIDHDDLVTLLWQAHLPHLEVDFVPSEADVAATEGEQGVPWPTAAAPGTPEPETAKTEEAPPATEGSGSARSDDWRVGEFTIEIEAGFEELQALAPTEVERFQREFEAERVVPLETIAVAVARAFLTAGAGPDDRAELGRFLPRVLRLAFLQGRWDEAAECLSLFDACGTTDWSKETFCQELLQPISVASIKERLESQDPAAAGTFVAFAQQLGEPSVDLLYQVMAEMQSARHQHVLSDAIVELCRSNPERLAPWLADPRWPVVKSIVQILGTIGGGAIVGLLQPLARHPEPRVRLEVLNALRNADPRVARPVLVGMIEGADTRMFCAVLQALSAARDAGVAEMLMIFLLDPDFEKRPGEEKRAIYSTLAAVGGDEILAELEAELHKGNWFQRIPEAHRQAMARCIARIGTPFAREMLERGVKSRRPAIRKACEEALVRFGNHD